MGRRGIGRAKMAWRGHLIQSHCLLSQRGWASVVVGVAEPYHLPKSESF